MTTVYFVRHAEVDHNYVQNKEKSRNEDKPLTDRGRRDCSLVTKFLKDKNIDTVFSSPYVRAIDTISPFAKTIDTKIKLVEDFREREKGKGVKFTTEFLKEQWNDFSYKLSNGECLFEVQKRNVVALQQILKQHKNKNIVIGTHGVSLGTIINYFDNSFGFEQSRQIGNPYVVKITFDGSTFVDYEMIDL
ncbi:MAG: histidine phosphatase family protein [Firmicutes bacterium]|nr:histidine phosphatase family protein [Bacillota bacterium]